MAKKETPTTKPSEPGKVDAYLQDLRHPLAGVLAALRRIILETDASIGEEIKWNAPTFFYSGEMQPSDPKEYKRYLVVSNVFQQDCIRLVFWGGDRADDGSGFLEGDYADGRRLALFYNMEDVRAGEQALRNVLKRQLETLDQ